MLKTWRSVTPAKVQSMHKWKERRHSPEGMLRCNRGMCQQSCLSRQIDQTHTHGGSHQGTVPNDDCVQQRQPVMSFELCLVCRRHIGWASNFSLHQHCTRLEKFSSLIALLQRVSSFFSFHRCCSILLIADHLLFGFGCQFCPSRHKGQKDGQRHRPEGAINHCQGGSMKVCNEVRQSN